MYRVSLLAPFVYRKSQHSPGGNGMIILWMSYLRTFEMSFWDQDSRQIPPGAGLAFWEEDEEGAACLRLRDMT